MTESNQTPAAPAVTDDTPIGLDVDLSQEDIRLADGTRLTNEMIPGLVEEIRAATADPVSGTAEWLGIEDQARLLYFRVGVWNDNGYPEPLPFEGAHPIPPLGERSADNIKAGHGAIEAIDEIVRDLQVLRDQLITELRTDEAARAVRVDAMLAETRAMLAETRACSCPESDGAIRHQRSSCTDPVVARLGWYADGAR